MTSWTKENIISFIELYRSCDCLWRIKSKQYSNKFLREKEYEKLVNFCKAIDPQANKDTVTKKIGNLRTCFKKELKKHEQSKLSGAGIEEIYIPKLWYFNELMFLKDQELPREARSNIGRPCQAGIPDSPDTDMSVPLSLKTESEISISPDNSENQEQVTQSQSLEETTQASNNRTQAPAHFDRATTTFTKKSRKRKSDVDDLMFMKAARERFLKPPTEDEFDVLGKSIAFRLRNLPKEQRFHAQKYISDILYEAELGQLSTVSPFASIAPQ